MGVGFNQFVYSSLKFLFIPEKFLNTSYMVEVPVERYQPLCLVLVTLYS